MHHYYEPNEKTCGKRSDCLIVISARETQTIAGLVTLGTGMRDRSTTEILSRKESPDQSTWAEQKSFPLCTVPRYHMISQLKLHGVPGFLPALRH